MARLHFLSSRNVREFTRLESLHTFFSSLLQREIRTIRGNLYPLLHSNEFLKTYAYTCMFGRPSFHYTRYFMSNRIEMFFLYRSIFLLHVVLWFYMFTTECCKYPSILTKLRYTIELNFRRVSVLKDNLK